MIRLGLSKVQYKQWWSLIYLCMYLKFVRNVLLLSLFPKSQELCAISEHITAEGNVVRAMSPNVHCQQLAIIIRREKPLLTDTENYRKWRGEF